MRIPHRISVIVRAVLQGRPWKGNKLAAALIYLAAAILSLMSITVPVDSESAESLFQPSILIDEEYNDNIFLSTDNRVDDYITRIDPSFTFAYKAPLWDWDIKYTYDYLYYAKNAFSKTNRHRATVINQDRIIDQFFFLGVTDIYTSESLDVARDFTEESDLVNQSDKNVFTASPFFVLKPTSQMTVSTGYVYSNTWYKNPTAIGRTDHIGYADIRQDMSARSTLIGDVKYTRDENKLDDYTQKDVSIGLKYEYSDRSSVAATVGNSWFHFQKEGRTSQVFWDATITQLYSTITVSYETGLRFIPDPLRGLRREDHYLATIRRDVERTSLIVSGGLKEYRNPEFKHLEETSYRLDGKLSHDVTTQSKIIFNLTTERLKNYLTGVRTDRYLTGLRLEHLYTEKLTLAAEYRYSNVYSPDSYLLNYYNNRFIVELKKVF